MSPAPHSRPVPPAPTERGTDVSIANPERNLAPYLYFSLSNYVPETFPRFLQLGVNSVRARRQSCSATDV